MLLNEDVTPEVFSGSLAAAVGAVDLAEVGSFTFVPMADVAPEAAEVYESEPNQANLETIREMFGADEITDLVVRFTVSDQEYFAFFSVVRYGDAWWVDQLGGNFASLVAIPPLRSGATPVDGIEEWYAPGLVEPGCGVSHRCTEVADDQRRARYFRNLLVVLSASTLPPV